MQQLPSGRIASEMLQVNAGQFVDISLHSTEPSCTKKLGGKKCNGKLTRHKRIWGETRQITDCTGVVSKQNVVVGLDSHANMDIVYQCNIHCRCIQCSRDSQWMHSLLLNYCHLCYCPPRRLATSMGGETYHHVGCLVLHRYNYEVL